MSSVASSSWLAKKCKSCPRARSFSRLDSCGRPLVRTNSCSICRPTGRDGLRNDVTSGIWELDRRCVSLPGAISLSSSVVPKTTCSANSLISMQKSVSQENGKTTGSCMRIRLHRHWKLPGCGRLFENLFALLEEFVLKMKYYRTGQKWQHRVCPKHAVELELCINDTDYSTWSREFQTTLANQDNRVAWRCDECIGYWFENHFIDCAEWSRPYLIERAQLVVSCPNCSSRRVTHTCEPACCGVHQCLDCNATLESHVEVVHEGEKTSRPRLRLRGQGWNASGPFRSDHMLRTGVRRDYRTCEKEHERMMELVLIDPIRICDAQVGWYCDDCERVN